MADRTRRVDYYYVEVPDQPGQGLQILSKLKEAGVNLLCFTAFPTSGNKAQIDLVPENGDALAKSRVVAGDDCSFERLQPFLVAFLDLYVNAYRIAWTERRDIGSLVFSDEFRQQCILHWFYRIFHGTRSL